MRSKDLSRRRFLADVSMTAAGVISSPYVITSTALGDSRIPPASDRVTVGHIGVGGQGTALLRNFLQLNGAQSVAVSDPFRTKREERSQEIDAFYAEKHAKGGYGGCQFYSDFRELLDDEGIDAVVIATPDHWHVPIALAAARAEKDMYVEKPLGISVAQDQFLRTAVARHGRIFQYGTQQRSGRNFRYACELARNRKIGILQTIHVWCTDISSQDPQFNVPGGSMEPIPVPVGFNYDMWIGPAPMTPYTSDRCTSFGTYHHYDNSLGFIAGWGAHPLDIAQWGNSSDDTAPVEYSGSGTIARGGLFETVSSWDMSCVYENGVKMRFLSTGLAEPVVRKYHPSFMDHGTTFIGTDGWVSVDRYGIYANPPSLLQILFGPDDIRLYNSANHYGNFIDSVKSRRATVSTVEAAVQSDIISHLCDIAIRLRTTIRWDPREEKIIDNETASRMLTRPLRAPWSLV